MSDTRSLRQRRWPWACLISGLAGWGLAAVGQFPDAPREKVPPLPERRAAILKAFDANGDGLLEEPEREAARKAWATKMLSQRGDRGFFGPPPELLEEFDRNKDGDLDEEEGRVARETMEKRFTQMRKDYDKNADGKLDPDEIAAASKDIDDGKLKGIPKMFLQFAAGGPRRGGPPGRRGPGGEPDDGMDAAEVVRGADQDGDGRLSASELETVRAAWARIRAAKNNPKSAVATPSGKANP